MNIAYFIQLSTIGALAAAGLYFYGRARRRQADDVLFDLAGADDEVSLARAEEKLLVQESTRAVLSDRWGVLGLHTTQERRRFEASQALIPLLFPVVLLVGGLLVGSLSVTGVVLLVIVGLALGYLYAQRRYRNAKKNYIRAIEFFLPIVMERVVMAVQAGLDIIPALQTLSALDNRDRQSMEEAPQGRATRHEQFAKLDPVSRLLRIVVRFSESGLSFEQSVRTVSDLVECSALRHAFVHLAVAQREGGELVMPLRELSDSTQLYFQESIEEELAAMPVKATLPLLCTFAGLILIFLTAPLVQIITMSAKAMPH